MKNNILDYLDQGGLKNCPDSVWLKEGTLSWTFKDFSKLSFNIGSGLINLGASIGRVIVVLLPNGSNMLIADFGIMRSGSAFMNVDVMLPDKRLNSLLEKVDPLFIITNKNLQHKIPAQFHESTLIYEDLLESIENSELVNKRRGELIDTDPACLIATSGSTGIPKCVALSHRGLVDFGDWFDESFEFFGGDVVGSLSPLFFDGYIPGLFMSLLKGGKFVILDKSLASFPVDLVKQLALQEITFIFWVPSTLVPIAKLKILDGFNLPKLKFIGFAGEVMPPTSLSYLRKKLPNAKYVNFYGPIEVSVICTFFIVPHDFPDDKPIPIGIPCKNTRILILDELGSQCEPKKIGELCVAGSSLALGYWNNKESTVLAFIDSEGIIHFVGRKDHQVKHQGYRIDLTEIEYAADIVLKGIPVCVLYHSIDKKIVLFYESKSEINSVNIINKMAIYLPKYMLPQKFINLKSIPKNPNGKIDRKNLENLI